MNGRTGSRVGERQIFGSRQEWRRGLITSGGIGLVLGVLGPFGSYLNPQRAIVVAYWLGALLAGEVLFGVMVRPARWAAACHHWPVAPAMVAAWLAMCAVLSLLCRGVAAQLWPGPIAWIGPGVWFGQTLLVASLVAGLHALAARRLGTAPVAAPAATGTGFLSRLPPHLGRDLIALQMEDHYVRAHTHLGSALILIPLRQALAELDGVPGLQVHRSWWVARRGVAGVVQDGRNMRLNLVNGLAAPVSRPNVAAVRAAGLG